MEKFFVRHKLSLDDLTYLSDSDSRNIIKRNTLSEEDIVEIETYERKFLGQITEIKPNSVEIHIVEDLGQRESEYIPDITVIQSLSNESKFNYFVEKSVEIGIERIIPIESKYSLCKRNKAIKNHGYWNKLVRDATEQSRNIFPTIIDKPIRISQLTEQHLAPNSIKICLTTTEVESPKNLKDYLGSCDLSKPVYIAIGPEKGWDYSDIDIFKNLGFSFVKLNGNILRTESTSLVVGSIIKYLKGEL